MAIGFVGAQQIYHAAADTTKVRQLMTAAAPSCLTCTSLSELSVCSGYVSAACCSQGGCESGEPLVCSAQCSRAANHMAATCDDFVHTHSGPAYLGLLPVMQATDRLLQRCLAQNAPPAPEPQHSGSSCRECRACVLSGHPVAQCASFIHNGQPLDCSCIQQNPPQCQSCTTLGELTLCTNEVNNVCCSQHTGCNSGALTACDSVCESVLTSMSKKCSGLIEANAGLRIIGDTISRSMQLSTTPPPSHRLCLRPSHAQASKSRQNRPHRVPTLWTSRGTSSTAARALPGGDCALVAACASASVAATTASYPAHGRKTRPRW
jgi:hypothetical protein